jgi:hypothetical protein
MAIPGDAQATHLTILDSIHRAWRIVRAALALLAVCIPALAPAQTPQPGFDHDSTGYRLDGAHRLARCLSCHGQGTLRGTPKECNQCHILGNRAGTTMVQGPSHVPTMVGVLCQSCHKSTVSFRIWVMDHTLTSLPCNACHMGQSFEGVVPKTKSQNHLVTTADCSGCHANTSTFTAWSMNHSFVGIATCNNCHGGQSFGTGVVPVSKGGNHIVTARDCLTCHSATRFVTFAGGRMGTAEHIANGNTATCSGCHGGQAFQGVTPVSKPGNHIVTSQDCALCHSTTNFAVGAFATNWTMNHSGIALNCIQCHNGTSFGTTAPLVPVSKINTPSPGHVPTGADCSNCHNVVNSSAKVPSLWSPSKKPQAHNAALLTGYSATVCYPCHGTTTATYFGVLNQCGTTKGQLAGAHSKCTATNCAGCHAGQTAIFK